MAEAAEVDRAIWSLIEEGSNAWDELSRAGVLDGDWTDDLKFTAIGMMWDFPCTQIAHIRFVLAKVSETVLHDDCSSTYDKMKTVRARGARLLDSMAEELRLDYGLGDRVWRRRRR